MAKKKGIDITKDEEFKKLPAEIRSQTLYKLHEMLLESSMHGGFVDGLIALRDKGDDLTRHVVLVMMMNDPQLPPDKKKDGVTYYREFLPLDTESWVHAIDGIKARIHDTIGKIPMATWMLPAEEGAVESKMEQRPADTWGITYVDGKGVLHAIDLDTMAMFVAERSKPA